MRRRKSFNRGSWLLQRERCRVAAGEPPPEDRAVRISDRLNSLMKRLGLEESTWLHALESEWVALAGPLVARHVRPGRYANGILTLYVDSAVWLHELRGCGRKELLTKLQARFGTDRIASIRLSPDPGS